MQKVQGMFVLLAAICLSSLLLTLMGAGWELGGSLMPLHAQERSPVNTATADMNMDSGYNVELIGQLFSIGPVGAVAVQGTYAYMGVENGLVIVDISQPATPTVVASLPLLGAVEAIAIENGYAYVAAGDAGLQVVYVADPINPVKVGFHDTPVYAGGVAVAGGYAYVADGVGLRVVDVNDPTTPVEVGFYDTPGYGKDVAVAGEYAYVADWFGGLRVVNVGDPRNPVEVAVYDISGLTSSVTVANRYAYVLTVFQGLRVVDMSDPTNPVEVGIYETPAYAESVVVVGNNAYVTDGYKGIFDKPTSTFGLRVVDVSDPKNPVGLSFYDTPGEGLEVAVVGGYAYVADGYAGLQILDVNDPANPSQVGDCYELTDPKDVVVVNGYAYVADNGGLRIVDVSAPQSPAPVGMYYGVSGSSHVDRLAVAEGYAYIAVRYRELHIVDISDPTVPTQVGFYDSPDFIRGVAVDGSYVYVAIGGSWNGLRVLNRTDPANPVEVGAFTAQNYVRNVSVAGGYAYVATDDAGLRVVDVRNPMNPVEVGSFDTPWSVSAVAAVDGYVYLADHWVGPFWDNWARLRIVDVRDPANPVEVGVYENSGYIADVVVVDSYAYLAKGYTYPPRGLGLTVIDMGDPTNPVEIGFNEIPGFAYGVSVADGAVYVAADEGLFILRYRPTSYPAAGRVTNWDGAPLPGVALSVGPTQTTKTGNGGNYTLSGLVTGTYTITPSREEYVFEPSSRTFSVPPLARYQDFTVSSAPIYAISGGVYESSLYAPVLFPEPVSLQLSNGAQTTTQVGFYTFANLPPGNYVVTPTLADHSFYPSSRQVTIPPNKDDQDFIVVKDPALSILGTVNQSNGEPFAGVQVQVSQMPTTTRSIFSGAALLSTELGISSTPSTTTDVQGRYAFLNLEPGAYAVTAHLDGYVLLPVSRTANLPTLNEYPFTVLPGPVTGTVTSGVTTTLTLTDTQGLTTTLAFPPDAIPAGTQVTVTPVQMPSFPGHVPVHHALELAVSSSAGRVPVLDFTQPVSVSVRYSVTDTRSISDTAGIRLWWLTEGEWLEAGQSCAPPPGQSHDEPTRVVHVIICRPGLYALAGPTYQRFVPWVVR